MNKKWLLPLLLLVIIAVYGVSVNNTHTVLKDPNLSPANIAWMLTATGLVLLMTPGLSFFYGGMVSRKNVISTMLQSFISMGVISIVWVVMGFSLAFGESIGGVGKGLIGNPSTYFFFNNVGTTPKADLAATIPLLLFALFQLKFAIITPALITGSFAERVRFSSYLLFMVLFILLIYCPLAHATWHPNGWLRNMGVLDFAGGTVVHMSAGFAALAGAMVLGKRKHATRETHAPANIPFVLLGTGMLWFGWFGFNGGSSFEANEIAALAFINTNTASASAMIAWILLDAFLGRRISALGACIGAVVGLVAITPAAGYVSVGSSIFIGTIAAFISNIAVHISSRSSVDDTLDVFPCHGVGGIVGMILTGVLASTNVNPAISNGLAFGGYDLFKTHLIALLIVSVFTFFGSFLLYKLVDVLLPMRVGSEEEKLGLDISQHGEKF
jgi:Amt family ammonium transporter